MLSTDSLRRRIDAWRSRRKLHPCHLVGRGANVIGSPYVENLGRIEIGEDFEIDSVPVPSHLVTGKSGSIRIGDHVKVAHGVAICSHASIEIGTGTILAPFAIVLDADFHGVMDRGAPAQARPIQIGRNVYVGAGAIILRGAVIGDDVVIAPNSVVSRRIPPGVRAAGVPAKPLPRLERAGT